MTLFETAAGWVGDQLAAVSGRTITYRRRQASVELTACPSRVDYEYTDQDGRAVLAQSMDYAFSAADLVLDGETVDPQEGDKIVDTIGGATMTFQAFTIGTRPCFEWIDSAHVRLVLHTKVVPN